MWDRLKYLLQEKVKVKMRLQLLTKDGNLLPSPNLEVWDDTFIYLFITVYSNIYIIIV